MKYRSKSFGSCRLLFILLLFVQCTGGKTQMNSAVKAGYVCLPCGSDCDDTGYTQPGTCPHCHMNLVEKSTVVFKKVAPGQVCSFIDSVGKNNILLLDVRTPEEFEGLAADKFGRLKNAMNIPVQELEKRIGELEKYKAKEIVVYCSHSHRSPRASYLLTQHGFTRVTNMLEGMAVWKEKVKDKECNEKIFVEQ